MFGLKCGRRSRGSPSARCRRCRRREGRSSRARGACRSADGGEAARAASRVAATGGVPSGASAPGEAGAAAGSTCPGMPRSAAAPRLWACCFCSFICGTPKKTFQPMSIAMDSAIARRSSCCRPWPQSVFVCDELVCGELGSCEFRCGPAPGRRGLCRPAMPSAMSLTKRSKPAPSASRLATITIVEMLKAGRARRLPSRTLQCLSQPALDAVALDGVADLSAHRQPKTRLHQVRRWRIRRLPAAPAARSQPCTESRGV